MRSLVLVFVAGCAAQAGAHDPIASDPVDISAEHPPAVVELNFESHGARLNGHLYLANGPGPHPTVVMLHGLPGNERNLDLAQALRRSGYNTLFFHFRGAWGSRGEYTLWNVVEDVAAATDFLRANAAAHRIDANRIALVGHSLGGHAALHGGARDETIGCVVALAAANLGRRNDGAGDLAAYLDDLDMLNIESGAAEVERLLGNPERYDTERLAERFRGRPVLLVAGDRDSVLPPDLFHTPLVAAFEAEPEVKLTHTLLPGDHSFSWSRIRLTRTVVEWLDANCR